MMKKLLISLAGVVLVFSGLLLYLKFTYPTTSPFTAIADYIYAFQHPHQKLDTHIMGFLPYWRVDDSKYIQFDKLSEINYFSLTIDENGHLLTNSKTNPGLPLWNSSLIKDLIAKTQITGNAFTLTVACQRNTTIEALLNSPTAQEQLISEILQQIHNTHVNGINLDIEYDGTPDSMYQQKFTIFASHLSYAIKKDNPATTLSLDLLISSGRHPGLFDLPVLNSLFDRFIGMTYDYFTAASEIAGPVAPLNGFAQNKYFFDVTTTYQDYLKLLPANKLIMGIPYYGWDYPVEDGKKIQSTVLPQNDTNGYPSVMSYGRMKTIKNIQNCQWDDVASSTWCLYTDPDTHKDHQVWIENERSLQAKYDLLKKLHLSGLAIWTLGYDKQYLDLWNLLEKNFVTK